MRQKRILSISIVILMICFGCEKSSDSPDLVTGLTGMYTGVWVVNGTGQVSGTCDVVKVSNTIVKLEMTAGGSAMPVIPGVKLSDGGNGKIILKYSDSSGTLDGDIYHKTIILTLVSGSSSTTFSGTRQ
jgi:hypothetical protein